MSDINAPSVASTGRDGFGATPPVAAASKPPRDAAPVEEPQAPKARPVIEPPKPASGLTTFQDEKSGRLVVRIFHSGTGQVIAEFPNPNQLDRYPDPSAGQPAPQTKIRT